MAYDIDFVSSPFPTSRRALKISCKNLAISTSGLGAGPGQEFVILGHFGALSGRFFYRSAVIFGTAVEGHTAHKLCTKNFATCPLTRNLGSFL